MTNQHLTGFKSLCQFFRWAVRNPMPMRLSSNSLENLFTDSLLHWSRLDKCKKVFKYISSPFYTSQRAHKLHGIYNNMVYNNRTNIADPIMKELTLVTLLINNFSLTYFYHLLLTMHLINDFILIPSHLQP